MSDRAWKAYETSNLPRYYFDLGPYRKNAAKNTTPFTPPVNLFFALQKALKMMKAEGLENIFARHDRLTRASRAAVKALGLPLLGPDDCASYAVTAVAPVSVEAEQIRSAMKKRFDIILAGGQNHLKGKIFRIGHLGFVSDRDLLCAIAALESCLESFDANPSPGSGIVAASEILNG
jgi:aspartate aminotransferase-like enzyme